MFSNSDPASGRTLQSIADSDDIANAGNVGGYASTGLRVRHTLNQLSPTADISEYIPNPAATSRFVNAFRRLTGWERLPKLVRL
jgi:hypothetical protein